MTAPIPAGNCKAPGHPEVWPPASSGAVSIRGEISGVVTLVARNGQIAAPDAAGFADIESGKPMRTDAIVQIMSQTKAVTGVAAMILVDQGKLNLTRPVQDYRPEFRGVASRRRGSGSQRVVSLELHGQIAMPAAIRASSRRVNCAGASRSGAIPSPVL